MASLPSTVSVVREALAKAATNQECSTVSRNGSIDLNSYNDVNKYLVGAKHKQDPPTTEDTKKVSGLSDILSFSIQSYPQRHSNLVHQVIDNLEDRIEQLNLTLAVYRSQQEQQTAEISNLRQGTANLKAQLIKQSTSRAWYISEFKNARKQLMETNARKQLMETNLAMEIISLRKEVHKLQTSREKAAQILRRASTRNSLVEL